VRDARPSLQAAPGFGERPWWPGLPGWAVQACRKALTGLAETPSGQPLLWPDGHRLPTTPVIRYLNLSAWIHQLHLEVAG
jgi:hypothetical protein